MRRRYESHLRKEPRTGIFFHYQQGERLKDFPEALDRVMARDNVLFYDALYPGKPATEFDIDPIPMETLLKVHTPSLIERVRRTGDFDGAFYSAAGTVSAAKQVASGKITNAFVFTGFGDHHAGSDFFGGGCYFNGAAMAIHELRKRFGMNRFAIIDTDAHHADGTWELFEEDPNVMLTCFCCDSVKDKNGNFNIRVPFQTDDDTYLATVKQVLETRVKAFCPEVIFWNWGYDGTSGDYGDMGLSADVHARLAFEVKKTAQAVCNGRLITVLCGGSRRDYARNLIPAIISVLSD